MNQDSLEQKERALKLSYEKLDRLKDQKNKKPWRLLQQTLIANTINVLIRDDEEDDDEDDIEIIINL